MELREIEEIVKSKLSEKRYKHSLAVMQRCVELAKIYGLDEQKAAMVGLAHDVAKEMDKETCTQILKENNVELDKIELENFALWHAKVGAIICKNVFRFSQDMVQAVENHTLGKRKMDLLSKILFVADATGLDRNWDDLEYARKLSEVSLDDTIIYIIDINIKDNIAKKRQIHPESIMLRNELLSEKNLL